MIAKLSGRIDAAGADHLVIDVGGVGYLVHASARTITAIGAVGEAASVHTEMQVSENDMRLIGFTSAAERDWFRLLVGVQGVGSKVALAILSALELDELKRAIGSDDAAMVARANGVGPKLAKRIVNELRDKAGAIPGGPAGSAPIPAGSHSADAVSALQNLGFKPAEASRAVAAAADDLGDDASLDALVRLALKKAAK
ncbi:Holliday junction branch migration protein RuvA [Novosphingopyxis sp. YJ-S2-01]|uniref:Holliday junction branch migration protein RuvA n=1 Tax=Novosphingopyxis sp. YJ-S2-01 TaxID=2794021 RepID=UPI000C3E4BCA|nr:Holliday junction branch migration protein RuvA [Novosphingopyxis sp. YJ-S2-01]MAC11583.1 Holliday junction branch migration protein RuvA [Sphingorhabdus sp.]MBH9536345.1 Holliday junction branch migration protein RuvA [Novosphingopyxis sp. YJ-S2-01]|tara:strand:+ start:1880 stop:2476 length:597 start_codon:yes stop_codon:yes gene_type:complete